jgi:hypothetical protein
MKRPLALLSSLVFASWSLLSCDQTCSDVGCGPAVNIEVPLPQVGWGTLHGFGVRVCRNSTCASGTFASLPATGETGLGYGITLTGWPASEIMECFVYSTGTLTIRLQNGQLKDGDRYMVTVTDATNTTVASFDKAATYSRVGAGGDSCGLVCTHATFE